MLKNFFTAKNFLPKNTHLFNQAVIIVLLVIIADLLSKVLIFSYLADHGLYQVEITGFFNIVRVYNTGVSFGMFDGLAYGKYLISIVALLIVAYLYHWLCTIEDKFLTYALSFVIGGAFGNTIDRLLNGSVADFLDFHFFNYHWPAFNVADSMITIGAFMIIYDEFFRKKNKG